MQRFDSLLKMFGRMTIYGAVLGAIAGMLVGFVILLGEFSPEYDQNIISFVAETAVISAIWGGMFGGMYGGASGLFCGFAMTVVTSIGYATVRNPRNYKIVMGTLTAVLTSGVFFLGGLWDLGVEMGILTWASALGMSVVIAVYASQITARKYINEISMGKEKAKV